MIRLLRGLPSLQRKLLYVAFASGLILLVYLLSTSHESHPRAPIQQLQETETNEEETKNELQNEMHEEVQPHLEVSQPSKEPVFNHVKPNKSQEIPLAHITQVPAHPDHDKNSEHTEDVPRNPYSGPTNDKQKAIVASFLHAWNAYKQFAWGHDELKPLSKGYQDWFGIGLTILDSLDTMHIMGLKKEFQLGREWVAHNLTFSSDHEVLLFEIVIRALGGLLSAYHFSEDSIFLTKATELGETLLPCFTGPTAIPCRVLHMKAGQPKHQEISTAESGTIQLEFRDLARSTGKTKYEEAVMAVSQHLHQLEKLDGLVACFINAHTGQFRKTSTVSVGASADSYYEYLLKQWIQTGKSVDWLKQDYLNAVDGIKKHLLRHTEPNHLAFVGAYHSMLNQHFRMEMEHLACFLPGTLALGYLSGAGGHDHLDLAADLTKTCYMMYKHMPTGLSPEVAYMNMNSNGKEDILLSSGAHYNLQRPETVESMFYMYRATKDNKYREWGWEIFQAFEKHTRVQHGYSSIDSVHRPEHVGHRDKMETFYLAETLKYLYLLFSDDPDLIPLDKYVINTEAHPLPVYDS